MVVYETFPPRRGSRTPLSINQTFSTRSDYFSLRTLLWEEIRWRRTLVDVNWGTWYRRSTSVLHSVGLYSPSLYLSILSSGVAGTTTTSRRLNQFGLNEREIWRTILLFSKNNKFGKTIIVGKGLWWWNDVLPSPLQISSSLILVPISYIMSFIRWVNIYEFQYFWVYYFNKSISIRHIFLIFFPFGKLLTRYRMNESFVNYSDD